MAAVNNVVELALLRSRFQEDAVEQCGGIRSGEAPRETCSWLPLFVSLSG